MIGGCQKKNIVALLITYLIIIYTYYPEYKKQGIDEGINPKTIVVVTNPIVDILQKYYFDKKIFFKTFLQIIFLKVEQLKEKNIIWLLGIEGKMLI